MNRTAVKSSNVAAIGYEPCSKVLEVEYLTGSIYQYRNVPLDVYVDLITAPSKGRFLNAIVRGKYESERIRERNQPVQAGPPSNDNPKPSGFKVFKVVYLVFLT